MRNIIFELCAETVDACLAGEAGGVDRIELCSGLSEGGLTPSHGLVLQAVERCAVPIHVLIRPRGGDFVYSGSEYDAMVADVLHAKELGATGVVFGVLNGDATVDERRTKALVDIAASMDLEMTFHRAFDATPSLPEAMEVVLDLGFDRILTSGGEADVVIGASRLASLVELSAGRIDIAVGGGLTVEHAEQVARSTGATHFHGSLQRGRKAARPEFTTGGDEANAHPPYAVDAVKVREMIERLRGA